MKGGRPDRQKELSLDVPKLRVCDHRPLGEPFGKLRELAGHLVDDCCPVVDVDLHLVVFIFDLLFCGCFLLDDV